MTLQEGALSKQSQHALMAKLTEVLMWWEKVPDTPRARMIMKGWIYEVASDADYVGGRSDREGRSYFVEIRIPANRLDVLAKQGLIRDFTKVILDADDPAQAADAGRRVWVTIHEIESADWGIGGHTDWLRAYTSALDDVGDYQAPRQS